MDVNELTVEVPANTSLELLYAMIRITGRKAGTEWAYRIVKCGGCLTTSSPHSIFGFILPVDPSYFCGPTLTAYEFEQVFL